MQTNFYSEIGEQCHGWTLSESHFTHPKYGKTKFAIGIIQEFDKVKQMIKKKLYPVAAVEDDPHLLCFNINVNGGIVELIPNNFQDFWKTRRGRRLKNNLHYKETRKQTKKEYDARRTTNNH
jgi:hypothetical protein